MADIDNFKRMILSGEIAPVEKRVTGAASKDIMINDNFYSPENFRSVYGDLPGDIEMDGKHLMTDPRWETFENDYIKKNQNSNTGWQRARQYVVDTANKIQGRNPGPPQTSIIQNSDNVISSHQIRELRSMGMEGPMIENVDYNYLVTKNGKPVDMLMAKDGDFAREYLRKRLGYDHYSYELIPGMRKADGKSWVPNKDRATLNYYNTRIDPNQYDINNSRSGILNNDNLSMEQKAHGLKVIDKMRVQQNLAKQINTGMKGSLYSLMFDPQTPGVFGKSIGRMAGSIKTGDTSGYEMPLDYAAYPFAKLKSWLKNNSGSGNDYRSNPDNTEFNK